MNTTKKLHGLLLLAGLLLTVNAYSQTPAMPFVRTRVPRTKITTTTRLDQLTAVKDSVETTIAYMDGLGRDLQTVMQAGTPAGKDLVQPRAYDAYGREVFTYLPYAATTSSTGNYKDNAVAASTGVFAFYAPAGSTGTQQSNGIVRTTKPYSQTVMEPSALNRVIEQAAPGTAWQAGQGHTIKMSYGANGQTAFNSATLTNNPGSNLVALYTVTINANQSRVLTRASSNTANYASGQLYLKVSMDENRDSTIDGCLGTIEEYKDIDNRIVLKRTYNKYTAPGSSPVLQMLSTYYVYDDLGNLSFVLPPGTNPDAAAAIPAATLNALCYQYRYDERGRMTAKKLPGKAWEYMVYNKRDQVVATQDSSLRQLSQWKINKYDALGRVIQTGIWQKSDPNFTVFSFRDSIYANDQWDIRNSSGTGSGYTVTSYPQTLTTILSINYYDNYDNIPNWVPDYANASASKMTNGLPVLSKVLVLNTAGTRLWQLHYYDDLGRESKTITQHYLGGLQSTNNYDDVSSVYNFTNQPVKQTRKHLVKNTDDSAAILMLTSTDSLTYDHKGRSVQHWNQLTNGLLAPGAKVLLSQVDYNELGQLYHKKLHSVNSGSSFYQTVTYNYNERGWMVKDSAQLFSQQLFYADGAVPQYNGNIASQSWRVNGSAVKTQAYQYDKLNRLLAGISSDGNSERGISYDVMGNVKTLVRYGANGATPMLLDSLRYHYLNGGLSNQADTIRDLSSNSASAPLAPMIYAYSGDGMTKRDGKNNNNIAYNVLDLPLTVTGTNNITYYYNAQGQKMARTVVVAAISTTTDYIGGIQYTTNGASAPVMDLMQTGEGRVRPSGSNYIYEYDLTDHLGNARLTFTTTGASATAVQSDDYYPFGKEISGLVNGTKNEYLYNKKELQEELGQYDYGARFYDPVIARWTSVDPKAEISRRFSPYVYGDDNPIRNIDPDGMQTQGCCDLPSLMQRTAKVAVNKVKEAATNAFVNTMKTLKNDFKTELKKLDVSVYGSAEGKLTVGGRISGGVKGTLKGDINAGSVTLLSGSADADSKAGASGDFNYILKDGKYERSFGAGGDILGGVSGGVSETINSNGKVSARSSEGGAEVGILQTKVQVNQSNGNITPVATVSAGFSPTLGLIFNYSGSVNVGIKVTRKSGDD